MKASDFMTRNPAVLSQDLKIVEVIRMMRKTRHNSFPVVENKKVVGILTHEDIILQPLKGEEHNYKQDIADSLDKKVSDIMTRRVIAVLPNMEMEAVARLMFRTGHSKFPVVDNEGNLLGIVTNNDVIRAHIERVTPMKVETTRVTLEDLHKTKVKLVEQEVNLSELIPTQGTIYLDELRAREYEIQGGLAEPLLVIKNGPRFILVDGHHRAVAARNSGIEKMKAYVLVFENEVELGMEKTAEKQGLRNLASISISDGLSPYVLPVVLDNGVVKRIV